VLVAASFAVAAAFFLTLGSSEERPQAATRFEGSLRPPGMPISDFTMRDERGKVATLREYRGKPVIVTFLYTTCEDTCPLTAQTIRGALDELGHDLPVLIFAVDPPRDTPKSAQRFLNEQRVMGRMRWLLGPQDELRRQWKAYGVQPQTDELEHSAYVVLLDKTGRQRIGWPAGEATPDQIANDLRILEREEVRPRARRAGAGP
jgi:protein SCO1/2